MKISVIIPCWNGEATLAHAIDSAIAEHFDVEVIVVDDGSTDYSRRVAKDHGAILVRNGRNKGQCRTRNQGVRSATGEFVQFLDCDDWLEAGKLDAHASLLAANEDLDATWGPLHVIGPEIDRVISQAEMHHLWPQVESCPQTNSMFFRKEILYGKPWPEELTNKFRGGTPYFWKRILKRNPTVQYSPEGIAVYNIGNMNSLSRTLPMYYHEDPEWPSP